MDRSRKDMSILYIKMVLEMKLTYSKLDRDESLDKRHICTACDA